MPNSSDQISESALIQFSMGRVTITQERSHGKGYMSFTETHGKTGEQGGGVLVQGGDIGDC